MKTSSLKLCGLIATLLLLANFALGQSPKVEITYSDAHELMINELPVGPNTSAEALTQILGEPSKTVDYPNGEISYFYEELGIVFGMVDGKFKVLGINFNWDGDKKFPEKSFVGTLKIGEAVIDLETHSETVAAIESVEFMCPIPMICATKDKDTQIKCLVAFEDNKITQVAFTVK